MDKLGVSLPWLITQTVNFLVVLFVLQQFAYKPLLAMLDRRKSEIANALANADKVKQEAATKQAEYERQLELQRREGQEAIARATVQADKSRVEIIAKANAEAEAIKVKARADTEYERKQAMTQLQNEVADLSLAMTRKVLGSGGVNEATHRQLVQQFLADLEKA